MSNTMISQGVSLLSKVKWNYIFGAVTITAIIGGTVYVIYKAKQAEALEEETITAEQAREMVKEQRESKFEKGEETVIFHSEIAEVQTDGPVIIKPEPIAVVKVQDQNDVENIEVEEIDAEMDAMDADIHDAIQDGYPMVLDDIPSPTIEPLIDYSYLNEDGQSKEEGPLRYHKDSPEAKHQFIRMELSDFPVMVPPYKTLLELFDFPFVPTNNGDEILRTQIIDYRMQFFGPGSKWNREVSYADVILHFARAAQFDLGETVDYWVDYFLDFNEFVEHMTSQQIETLLMRLNSHTYFNEERQTFGLFGLSREGFDQAIRIGQTSIYRQVTYQTEFEEFLKSHL